MASLFLYGTLRDAPLLSIVLGEGAPAPQPARLPGARVLQARSGGQGQIFPLLSEEGASQEDVAEGVLVRDLPSAMLDRVIFYEAGFSYDLQPRQVLTAEGPAEALVFVPRGGVWQAGGPWDFAAWARDWAGLSRDTARAAMALFGQIGPGDLAARLPMLRARAWARILAARDPVPARLRSATPAAGIALSRSDSAHDGFFALDILHLRHPLFGGGMSAPMSREVFIATDAAILLPYDPVRDRVLLVEQIRMGPYARGEAMPWMLEPVAGRVDGGEDPREAAIREAREEAGLEIRATEHIASFYPTPGYSSEYFHCYLGLCDLPDGEAGLGGLETEHEDIRSHVLSFDEAHGLIASGEAAIGPLILCLMWLEGQRARLRASA